MIDQKIPIVAKCDIGGLGNFIRKNLFTNEYISKKHSHATVVNMKLPTFKVSLNIVKYLCRTIYFAYLVNTKETFSYNIITIIINKSELLY